jgi:two-component system, LytTR family, sensor kinase
VIGGWLAIALLELLLRVVLGGLGWNDLPAMTILILGTTFLWMGATPIIGAWSWQSSESDRPLAVRIMVHLSLLALLVVADALVLRAVVSLLGEPPKVSLATTLVWYLDTNCERYAAVAIVAHALQRRRRLAERELRALEMERELSRAQLSFLELQLHPHFLFNALGTIAELAHESPATAARMVRQLRTLWAAALEHSGRDEVTLGEELELLGPYLDIQRTRFSDWLTLDITVDSASLPALVPALVLQPLVENAIQHGLSGRSAPGHVSIAAATNARALTVTVHDDGVGFTGSSSDAHSGIGLRNVRERLLHLYGDGCRFVIASESGGGTLVTLELPFRVRRAADVSSLSALHAGAA